MSYSVPSSTPTRTRQTSRHQDTIKESNRELNEQLAKRVNKGKDFKSLRETNLNKSSRGKNLELSKKKELQKSKNSDPNRKLNTITRKENMDTSNMNASIHADENLSNEPYDNAFKYEYNLPCDDNYDDNSSVDTTDEIDSNQQIIEMKSQRIQFLEGELRKTSNYLIDIQTKLHQTQLLLEATEVANREGNDNKIIAELDAKIKAVTEENRSLKEEMNDLKIEKQEFELNTKQLLLQLHDRENQIKYFKEESSRLSNENAALEADMAELNHSLDAKTEEIRDFREKISELEMEKLQLRERYILKTEIFNVDELSNNIEKNDDEESSVNIQTLRKDYETLKLNHEELLSKYQTLYGEAQQSESALTHLKEESKSLRENINHHTEIITTLKERLGERDDEVKNCLVEIASLQNKINTLTVLLDQKSEEELQQQSIDQSDENQRIKQLERLVSSLRAKISHYTNNEGILRDTVVKLQSQVQHFQGLIIFYSGTMQRIILGESALHSQNEKLNQKCILLERECSSYRHQNEELQVSNSQMGATIRELSQQVQEKKADCTILAKQLNHSIDEYFLKHKDDLQKLFTNRQPSKVLKLNYRAEEDLCNNIERLISAKSKSISKDESTKLLLRSAIQSIKKFIQSNNHYSDTIQKLQADAKVITQLQPRFFKLLSKIEIERDVLLQKQELIQKELEEHIQRRDEQISKSTSLLQSQIQSLYKIIADSNDQIMNTTSQLVECKSIEKSLTQQLEEKSSEILKMHEEFERKYKEQEADILKTSSILEASIQKYYDETLTVNLRNEGQSPSAHIDSLLSEIHGQKQLEKSLHVDQRALTNRIHVLEELQFKQKQTIELLTHEIGVLRQTITNTSKSGFAENALQNLQKRYDNLLHCLMNKGENHSLPQSEDASNLESNNQIKAANSNLLEENNRLISELRELKKKLQQYDEIKNEEQNEYEQQLVAFEGQNNILISKLATHKLQIDELTNSLKEKEAEIEQLHSVLSKKLGPKKKEVPIDVTDQLKSLVKASSITHAKLRQALQNEIDLRDKLEQKTTQVGELKKALETVQKGQSSTGKKFRTSFIAGSPIKASSRSIVRLSGALTEREGEINMLRKSITTLELEIAKLREDLEAEKHSHRTNIADYEKQISSLNEKLQASISQKRELEKRIEIAVRQSKTQENSLDAERESLIRKLQEITSEHEKLHEEFSAQNLDYVDCKVLLGKRESELVEKENQIQVLKDHLKQVRESLEVYKSELKNKAFEYEKSQVISDGTLDKTLTHLQQEQSNVQKLMDLVHKLQQENDLLMKEKINAQKLRDQLQALHPKYEQLLREKESIDEQFTAAKDYILQLRQERDHIKQNLKQEKERLSTEMKNFNSIQKQQEEVLQRRVNEMEERLEECQKEFREKETVMQDNFQQYIIELKDKIENEKQGLMKDRIIFQKSEHRFQKSISELEESLRQEIEKRKDAEKKLLQEKEQNMEQVTQIDQDFRSYKDAQEKVIDVYEKELRELKENAHDIQILETQIQELKQNIQERDTIISNLEVKNRDNEQQINELKSKTKLLNKQLTKLQKESSQEKELLQERIEEISRNQEEISSTSEELKAAKKQIKQLIEEHAKKSKIISSLKEERDEQQEKILKYESEQQQYIEKIKTYSKDMTRKEQLVREYKTKLETKKQDFKSKEDQNNNLKAKIKELTNSDTRKEKLIKDLQTVIEQKNKFASQLKNQVKHAEEDAEKKETRLKGLETKLERLQQTEELKQKHLTEQAEAVRTIIFNLAEDHVKAIEKLEIQLNAAVASSNQINSILRRQISSSSLDSIISRNSNKTTERSFPDTSSISMHMLNLSPEELQDIMSSTRNLDDSIATRNQKQEVILQRNDKSESARAQLLFVKKYLSQNDVSNAKKALDKIIRIRLDLEKALSVATKESFFNQSPNIENMENMEETMEDKHEERRRQDEVEAQNLKEELKKMQEREQIYESTIQSLELHLNQLLAPDS